MTRLIESCCYTSYSPWDWRQTVQMQLFTLLTPVVFVLMENLQAGSRSILEFDRVNTGVRQHRHRNRGGTGGTCPPQVFNLCHAHSICPVLQIYILCPPNQKVFPTPLDRVVFCLPHYLIFMSMTFIVS